MNPFQNRTIRRSGQLIVLMSVAIICSACAPQSIHLRAFELPFDTVRVDSAVDAPDSVGTYIGGAQFGLVGIIVEEVQSRDIDRMLEEGLADGSIDLGANVRRAFIDFLRSEGLPVVDDDQNSDEVGGVFRLTVKSIRLAPGISANHDRLIPQMTIVAQLFDRSGTQVWSQRRDLGDLSNAALVGYVAKDYVDDPRRFNFAVNRAAKFIFGRMAQPIPRLPRGQPARTR